ncbi:MAG: 30S ribosomal protein S13, partial [Candidatus Micrarchaeaceae archaeon]
ASKTWRGFRHQYGQKVRGQSTRSTGRTGITVGVTKKSIQTAEKAAKAPAKGAEKKK